MSKSRRSRGLCQLEQLESRFLLSGVVSVQDATLPVVVPAFSAAQPDKGLAVKSAALTPAQVRTAYSFNGLGDGTGQTIAIIDAYDAYYSGTLLSDLATFDSTYNLPACNLKVATPQGTPGFNSGWAQEMTLDVEWAHAIAPGATILLVETQSNSLADLFGGVDAAVASNANVVSMSWGGSEFAGETSYDSHFSSAPGITFVASSGDTGGKTQYPAVSPYVVGVGGTSLKLDSSGNWISETGWSGSGGGLSQYETKPGFQSGVVSGSKRASPDVAYDADPNTGVSVYYNGGWWKFGGTSVGTPQWAALVAVADQSRSSSLGSSDTLAALYAHKTDFHDITSGTAGKNRAGTGYDLVTGMGSPFANRVAPDLAAAAANSLTVAGTTGSGGSAAAPAQRSPFSDGKHIKDVDDVLGSMAASVLS